MIDRIDITKQELDVLVEESSELFFDSPYGFLRSHGGFRPGKLHTILGTSGGGKSTLVRSILLSTINAYKNKNFLLWLSEETENDFLTEMHRAKFSENLYKPLHLFSEIDNMDYRGKLLFYVREYIIKNKIELVIFDNITTSSMYADVTIKQQTEFAKALKQLALQTNAALVIIAHTGAGITENSSRLIDMNDIRGAKTIVNLSEFFYVLQSFQIENHIFPTITIRKHRGQEAKSKMFRLKYDPVYRLYTSDAELSFKDFKDAFKRKNTL